jgi:hypothetical protein
MLSSEQEKWLETAMPVMEKAFRNPTPNQASPIDLTVCTNYSTFFAEWMVRDDDVLVHLFPRAGRADEWQDGHYIARCRKCDREVRDTARPCSCGHKGLRYIPGRREIGRTDARFPTDMQDRLTRAVDRVWLGSVAIESTRDIMVKTANDTGASPDRDIGAWVLQLQGAAGAVDELAVERLFDSIDQELELA